MKLTPAPRRMLERIAEATDRHGSMMVISIIGSGGRARNQLQQLINAGYAEMCDHDLPRGPVDGVRITQAGRTALGLSGKASGEAPALERAPSDGAAAIPPTPGDATQAQLIAAWHRLHEATQGVATAPAADLTAAVEELMQAREEMRNALWPFIGENQPR